MRQPSDLRHTDLGRRHYATEKRERSRGGCPPFAKAPANRTTILHSQLPCCAIIQQQNLIVPRMTEWTARGNCYAGLLSRLRSDVALPEASSLTGSRKSLPSVLWPLRSLPREIAWYDYPSGVLKSSSRACPAGLVGSAAEQ